MPSKDSHTTFALMRERSLPRREGYWRSLEELADSDEFQEFIEASIRSRQMNGTTP